MCRRRYHCTLLLPPTTITPPPPPPSYGCRLLPAEPGGVILLLITSTFKVAIFWEVSRIVPIAHVPDVLIEGMVQQMHDLVAHFPPHPACKQIRAALVIACIVPGHERCHSRHDIPTTGGTTGGGGGDGGGGVTEYVTWGDIGVPTLLPVPAQQHLHLCLRLTHRCRHLLCPQ